MLGDEVRLVHPLIVKFYRNPGRFAASASLEIRTSPVQTCGESREIGRCETGVVREQMVRVSEGAGENQYVLLRRITIQLDTPTADGDCEIHVLTNLPAEVSAITCVELYRKRWSIEALFGELTSSLHGEIDTLGYPPAALLAYSIALVTYNLLALVRTAMRAVHVDVDVNAQVSTYYMASETTATWAGPEIAVPTREWNSRIWCAAADQLSHATAGYGATRRSPSLPQTPSRRKT